MRFFCALLVVLAVGCAHSNRIPSAEELLAARQNAAPGKPVCTSWLTTAVDCIDDAGLIWSACAWNACGRDPECRRPSDIAVLAGGCGTPGYLSCEVPEDVRRAYAVAYEVAP